VMISLSLASWIHSTCPSHVSLNLLNIGSPSTTRSPNSSSHPMRRFLPKFRVQFSFSRGSYNFFIDRFGNKLWSSNDVVIAKHGSPLYRRNPP
jgi:hypothetical protein